MILEMWYDLICVESADKFESVSQPSCFAVVWHLSGFFYSAPQCSL